MDSGITIIIIIVIIILYYAIHSSTPAHKHKLLTTKNTSRLHLKYKNVNTNLKAPIEPAHTQQS